MENLKEKILMVSKKTADNYLMLLERSLLKEGIKVSFIKKLQFWFPLLVNILNSKFKIVHFHWISNLAGFQYKNKLKSLSKLLIFFIDIILVKLFFKKKIVWTVHNLYSHESYSHKIEKLGRKLFSRLVDIIIAHCIVAKRKIIDNYNINPNKIIVIPFGNYNNIYKNNISKQKAREFLKLKNNDFIFLCFGPIRPYKGIFLLINTFKSLKLAENIKLMVIGKILNKQMKKEILELSKENKNIILNFDFIPDDEIQYYMNASDVVVFSYRKILSSAGIFLAMSFSKAIVAPRLGCLINTLDEKGAFLYNTLQKDGLLFALKEALNNIGKISEMGLYNLNLSKKFDWREISKKTKKVYTNFLK